MGAGGRVGGGGSERGIGACWRAGRLDWEVAEGRPPSSACSSLLACCRTQTCRFSGLRIYPGKGTLYIRTDGQQFLFARQKCRAMFNQRKRPAKLAWTVLYRKAHRKDQELQVARKKRRAVNKAAVRSVAGASLEVLAKKKAEKPEQRKASREAALR